MKKNRELQKCYALDELDADGQEMAFLGWLYGAGGGKYHEECDDARAAFKEYCSKNVMLFYENGAQYPE